jgi:hypothetical protein
MSGLARDIDIEIVGRCSAPVLALSITPQSVAYQFTPPKGTSLKSLIITGGSILFSADKLELKELPISAQTGKLVLSASFAGSGDGLAPKSVHIKSSGIDVTEVEQYLASPDMPSETRKTVQALVAPLQLSSVSGKTYGDLKVTFPSAAQSGNCSLDGVVGFNNVAGKFFQQQVPFEHLCGVMSVSSSELAIQDLSLVSGSSRFTVQGNVKNIQQTPLWNLQLGAQFKPEDIVRCLPVELSQSVSASAGCPLALHATIIGDRQSQRVVFDAKAAANAKVSVRGPFGTLHQPANEVMSTDGTVVLHSGASNSAQLENFHICMGDALLQGSGKYDWEDGGNKPPALEFVLTMPKPVAAVTIASMLSNEANHDGGGGTIKGTLAAAGTTESLLTHGDFTLTDVTVPAWNMKNVNGRLHSPRWTIGSTADPAVKSQMQVQIDSGTFAGIPMRNASGTILVEGTNDPRISVSDGTAEVAGGTLNLNGTYRPASNKWHVDMTMSQLRVDEFITDLIEHSGEVTGLADGKISLDTAGGDWNALVSNLQGKGEINVVKGSVPKVGALQEKLSQANLLQQGIFGFNINNVFQSMLPVKAGKFKQANMSFEITSGVVGIDRLTFDGNDLRLRAAGVWNIPLNTLNVEVAGNIPRVASSIIPGAMGEVSRNFTLQKAVRVMTFHKLENFPNVPILGDIGTDDPRAFMFKIACSLASPNAVQQSISKSFRWLPNKPNASAHPVPGLPTVLADERS